MQDASVRFLREVARTIGEGDDMTQLSTTYPALTTKMTKKGGKKGKRG